MSAPTCRAQPIRRGGRATRVVGAIAVVLAAAGATYALGTVADVAAAQRIASSGAVCHDRPAAAGSLTARAAAVANRGELHAWRARHVLVDTS